MGVRAVLRIGRQRVALRRADTGVVAQHQPDGDWLPVESALRRLRRVRAGRLDSLGVVVQRAGRTLGEHFLGGAAGAALEGLFAEGVPVRLAVEVREVELDSVPWEAVVLPGGGTPLGLMPDVEIYRSVRTGRRIDVVSPPGPLRILAVVASPASGGVVLDHERELQRLIRVTEQRSAEVEVLEWGTVNDIRAALAARPRHVLHLTGHAQPGAFQLEAADGSAALVGAETFVREAVPPGRMPPVLVLAGCATGAAVVQESADGQRHLAGLARGLIEQGARTVLAMTEEVADTYATRLLTGLYSRLAADPDRDFLNALGTVRRRTGSSWWVPTLYAAPGRAPLPGPNSAGPLNRPTYHAGFVGRRTERRLLRALLTSDNPRATLHGLAGSGTSALAEAAARDHGGVAIFAAASDGSDAIRQRMRTAPAVLCVDFRDDDLTQLGVPVEAELGAMLAAWRGPLVLTGRRPVLLPGVDMYRIGVGPLSPAETHKLRRAVPALAQADAQELDQEIGGHPGGLMRVAELIDEGRHDAVRQAVDRMRAESGLAGLVRDVEEHRSELELAAVFAADGPAAWTERLDAAGIVAGGTMHTWVANAVLAGASPEAIADAHREAARQWRTRSAYTETGLRLARRHLHAAGEITEALEVTEQLCRFHAEGKEWDEAESLYREALNWVRARSVEAAALRRGLGSVEQGRGRIAAAERCFDDALVVFRREQDDAQTAETLLRIGDLARRRGDQEITTRCSGEARQIMERLSGQGRVAAAFRFLAAVDRREGQLVEAERGMRRALDLYQRAGDQPNIATSYLDLGDIYAARGRPVEASVAFEKTAKLVDEHGLPFALKCSAMARSWSVLGPHMEPGPFYDAFLAILLGQEVAGDLPGLFRSTLLLADWHHARDEPDRAYGRTAEALEIAEDLHDGDFLREAHLRLSAMHDSLNHDELTVLHAAAAAVAAPLADEPVQKLSFMRSHLGAAEYLRLLQLAEPNGSAEIERRVRAYAGYSGRFGTVVEVAGMMAQDLRRFTSHRLTFEAPRSARSNLAVLGNIGLLFVLATVVVASAVSAVLTRVLSDAAAAWAVAVAHGGLIGLAGVLVMFRRRHPGRVPHLMTDPSLLRVGLFCAIGVWFAGLVVRPLVPDTLAAAFYRRVDWHYPFLHGPTGGLHLAGAVGVWLVVSGAGVWLARRGTTYSRLEDDSEDLEMFRRGGWRRFSARISLDVRRRHSADGEIGRQLMAFARASYVYGRPDEAAVALFEYLHLMRAPAADSVSAGFAAEAELLRRAGAQMIGSDNEEVVADLVREHVDRDPVYGDRALGVLCLSRARQRLDEGDHRRADGWAGEAVRCYRRVCESDREYGRQGLALALLLTGRSQIAAGADDAAREPLEEAERLLIGGPELAEIRAILRN